MSAEDAREAAVEEALLRTVRELDDAIKARVAAELESLGMTDSPETGC